MKLTLTIDGKTFAALSEFLQVASDHVDTHEMTAEGSGFDGSYDYTIEGESEDEEEIVSEGDEEDEDADEFDRAFEDGPHLTGDDQEDDEED